MTHQNLTDSALFSASVAAQKIVRTAEAAYLLALEEYLAAPSVYTCAFRVSEEERIRLRAERSAACQACADAQRVMQEARYSLDVLLLEGIRRESGDFIVSDDYEPLVDPASFAEVTAAESTGKLCIHSPVETWGVKPVRFGCIASPVSVDLYAGAGGHGLLTLSTTRGRLSQVIPPHSFSLAKYDLSAAKGRDAAREYVRRKVRALAPI